MIQIYRFYNRCMLLSLFIVPSYFSYLISYMNGMIIFENEWQIFIHSSCTPCCGCDLCTIFWVLSLWQVHKEVWKNKQHVWHEIVSWNCRFKHVIGTCRLCHCTPAMSGYHKYVRLKMDGLLEPWQTLKYEVCVMCVAPMKIQCQLVKVYGVCVIPWKQADMVRGFQQWQDRCWQAPSISTTNDAWHTDMFSCWRCQRARHSLSCAQNCLWPTGLQRSVYTLGAKDDKALCMGLYGLLLYPFDMLHWSKRTALELKHG